MVTSCPVPKIHGKHLALFSAVIYFFSGSSLGRTFVTDVWNCFPWMQCSYKRDPGDGIKEDVHDWKLIIKLRKLLPLVSSDCKLRSFVPAQFYIAFLSRFPINLLLPSVFARTQCCSAVLCSECKAGIGVACLRETWPQLLGSVCAQQHGDGITELLVLFVSLCTWREQI